MARIPYTKDIRSLRFELFSRGYSQNVVPYHDHVRHDAVDQHLGEREAVYGYRDW